MTADATDTWLGRAIRDAAAGAARDVAAERSQRGKRARNYGYETERMVARWLRGAR